MEMAEARANGWMQQCQELDHELTSLKESMRFFMENSGHLPDCQVLNQEIKMPECHCGTKMDSILSCESETEGRGISYQELDEYTKKLEIKNEKLITIIEDNLKDWHSVTERLPECGILVLAYFKDTVLDDEASMCVAYTDADGEWWEVGAEVIVTHWQNLPNTPQNRDINDNRQRETP